LRKLFFGGPDRRGRSGRGPRLVGRAGLPGKGFAGRKGRGGRSGRVSPGEGVPWGRSPRGAGRSRQGRRAWTGPSLLRSLLNGTGPRGCSRLGRSPCALRFFPNGAGRALLPRQGALRAGRSVGAGRSPSAWRFFTNGAGRPLLPRQGALRAGRSVDLGRSPSALRFFPNGAGRPLLPRQGALRAGRSGGPGRPSGIGRSDGASRFSGRPGRSRNGFGRNESLRRCHGLAPAFPGRGPLPPERCPNFRAKPGRLPSEGLVAPRCRSDAVWGR